MQATFIKIHQHFINIFINTAAAMPGNLTEANLAAGFKPTLIITLSEAVAIDDPTSETDELDDEFNYDGINWDRLKSFQKPFKSIKRTPSFVYGHGYRI